MTTSDMVFHTHDQLQYLKDTPYPAPKEDIFPYFLEVQNLTLMILCDTCMACYFYKKQTHKVYKWKSFYQDNG